MVFAKTKSKFSFFRTPASYSRDLLARSRSPSPFPETFNQGRALELNGPIGIRFTEEEIDWPMGKQERNN